MKLTEIKGTLKKAGFRVLAKDDWSARHGVKVRLINAAGYPVKAADAVAARVLPIGLGEMERLALRESLSKAGFASYWAVAESWQIAPLIVKAGN